MQVMHEDFGVKVEEPLVMSDGFGKCPERFVREEILEECFTNILNTLALDEEVVNLVAVALRQSHQDAKQFHDEAVARLQAEYTRIQGRIDAAPQIAQDIRRQIFRAGHRRRGASNHIEFGSRPRRHGRPGVAARLESAQR